MEGSSRLRLQVGLKGAEQKAAHRPAMNVALVLHVPSAVELTDLSARIRALVGALDRARWPGDRFSLVLAGPGGGLLVAPEQFRHGPLAVALELFQTFRSYNGAFFKAVDEAEWDQTFSHPERGEMTLTSALWLYANHPIWHIDHISRTADAWNRFRSGETIDPDESYWVESGR